MHVNTSNSKLTDNERNFNVKWFDCFKNWNPWFHCNAFKNEMRFQCKLQRGWNTEVQWRRLRHLSPWTGFATYTFLVPVPHCTSPGLWTLQNVQTSSFLQQFFAYRHPCSRSRKDSSWLPVKNRDTPERIPWALHSCRKRIWWRQRWWDDNCYRIPPYCSHWWWNLPCGEHIHWWFATVYNSGLWGFLWDNRSRNHNTFRHWLRPLSLLSCFCS